MQIVDFMHMRQRVTMAYCQAICIVKAAAIPHHKIENMLCQKIIQSSLSSHMVTEMPIFQISGNHVCQIWWILPQKHQCGELLHKIIHEEKSDL
jgi:hypothetical protein